MVKYQSLLGKYYYSNGKENSFAVNTSEHKIMSLKQKPKETLVSEEDVYVPSWRAVCDAWVTECVEERSGVNTPVYQLYNAYINDNPGDYMDIGQFGKVLRSRFPYRKRRRGKQGQQVYVYQDVALKNREDSAEEDARPQRPTSGESNRQNYSMQQMAGAGPAIVIGNNTGGRLLSSPESVIEEIKTLTSSPVKRKGSESSYQKSPSPKRFKKDDDTESIDVPSTSALHQNTHTTQPNLQEPLNLTTGDEKYANSNLCRMAIGRRWIDTNLTDMQGTHTYADDICQAYARDNPNEPLNFTSLALLIRGKYPGRRRKVAIGSETRFLYQDIKLINQAGRPQENATLTSSVEADDPTDRASPLSTKSTSNNPTHRASPPFANRLVTLPVSLGATTNVATHGLYYTMKPIVFSVPSGVDYRNLKPIVTGAIPSTSYIVAEKSDVPVWQPTTMQRNIPNIEDLLKENDKVKKLPNHNVSPSKAKSNDVRNKHKSSVVNQEEKSIRKDRQEVVMDSQNKQTEKATNAKTEKAINATADMNVSEYLEGELLDINDITKNVMNYKVSIKVPSGNQVEMPESIPTFSKDSHWTPKSAHVSESKIETNQTKNQPTKFKKLLVQRSYNESITGASSISTDKPSNTLVAEGLAVIGKETTPCVKESNEKIKRSWDHGIRKCVSPETPETLLTSKNKRKTKTKDQDKRKNKVLKAEERSSASGDNSLGESKECTNSIILKGHGGSPTSTSPPGAAMFRLGEEIGTSTPHVAESFHQVSPRASSSTTVQEPRTSTNLHVAESFQQVSPHASSLTTVQEPRTSTNSPKDVLADPLFKKVFNSVMLSVRKTLSNTEEPLNEILIDKSLEQAVIEKNPAVFYEDDFSDINVDSLPCSVMPDLKDLVLSSPEHVNKLLQHHQSCPGLGCSKECQTLRAAYIHISIFHHKCEVWKAFSKIISKHSRPCRVVSCGVEFCQFVKHELHLNGVSVLPMQLMKERPTLEEEFKKCEQVGTHNGLHCHNRQSPRLPVVNSAATQLRSNDQQQTKAMGMKNNSIFPDTPRGNAMAIPVLKTLRLVKDLFRNNMEVG